MVLVWGCFENLIDWACPRHTHTHKTCFSVFRHSIAWCCFNRSKHWIHGFVELRACVAGGWSMLVHEFSESPWSMVLRCHGAPLLSIWGAVVSLGLSRQQDFSRGASLWGLLTELQDYAEVEKWYEVTKVSKGSKKRSRHFWMPKEDRVAVKFLGLRPETPWTPYLPPLWCIFAELDSRNIG